MPRTPVTQPKPILKAKTLHEAYLATVQGFRPTFDYLPVFLTTFFTAGLAAGFFTATGFFAAGFFATALTAAGFFATTFFAAGFFAAGFGAVLVDAILRPPT